MERTSCGHILRSTRYGLRLDDPLIPEGPYEDWLFRGASVWGTVGRKQPVSSVPEEERPREAPAPVREEEETAREDPFRFYWRYPEATDVKFRFRPAGQERVIEEKVRSEASFGGRFYVDLPSTLPSGVKMEVDVIFMRRGSVLGRLEPIAFGTAEKEILWSWESVTVGKLFKKKTYWRLRLIAPGAQDMTDRLGVMDRDSGCLCRHILWERDGGDQVSEYLP